MSYVAGPAGVAKMTASLVIITLVSPRHRIGRLAARATLDRIEDHDPMEAQIDAASRSWNARARERQSTQE